MTDRLEIKADLSVTDAGEITGIAWPFGTADRMGDVIEKGAFSGPKTLPMLFAHDQAQVVGVWDELTETDAGLTVKGRLLIEDVERAREVRAMVKSGAISGLSIGFFTKDAKRVGKGRKITALELHEISIVAVPAHPGAQITSLKSSNLNKAIFMENEEIELNEQQAKVANAPQVDTKAFDRMNARLDALEAKSNRPTGAPSVITCLNPDQKAFVSYLQGNEAEKNADNCERQPQLCARAGRHFW